MKRSTKNSPLCPCGSIRPYAECCEPLHQGMPAADAESLMRSRYSAYALKLENYLRETWHPKTRPDNALFDDSPPKWIGLEIKSSLATGENSARVEFIARCRIGGRAQRMRELSHFVRENDRWFYLDGEQFE